MRVIALLLPLLLVAPALAQAPASQGAPAAQTETTATLAGKVEATDGSVRILDRERKPRAPKANDPLYEGESIVTGADGEVQVQMEDGGLIAVRPNTKMRIVQFRAEGDDSDRFTIGLLEGSLRSVTGWIAKLKGNRYQVRTPTSTIGVRGTDHEPFHIPEGSPLGEPGTYDKVNQGGTYLQTKQGRVEVAQGKAAYAPLKLTERPRLLERVPAIFRPGRHDQRITQRYHEIQQRLPQQRDERRRQTEERRKKQEQGREPHKEKKAEQREAHKERQVERHEAQKKHDARKNHEARKDREARKDDDARKAHKAHKAPQEHKGKD